MFLRTPQLIRAVLFWCDFKDKKTPLFWCRKWKNKCFAYEKTHFFVIPHVMYWWSWHSLPDDLATELDFNMLLYWWMWHNLPDDLATDLHLHRTANYNQKQAFIQVKWCWNQRNWSHFQRTFSDCFFSHSNCSSSSRNLWGSGLSRVERQHHMNTYCVTDGWIVECPRSLCFKTMWAGRNSFKVLQDRSNVWVPAILETLTRA